MAIIQASGTTLGASATLAATKDDTGVNALTFTAVGKVGDLPPFDGTYDTATFDSLSDGEEFKLSDIFRAGGGTVQLALDEDDTGQGIMETAAATGATIGVQFTLRNNVKYYREAIVRSFMPSNIAVGGIVRADCELDFTGRTVKITP